MITNALRSKVLAGFPRGTPVVVAAADPVPYAELVAARSDPALVLVAFTGEELPADERLAEAPHVLLEGLDTVEDPVRLLANVAARAPAARLFGFVANAAHVRSLAAAFSGEFPRGGHPLVRAELEPLFRAAGWAPLAVTPVADATIVLPHDPPFTFRLDEIAIRIEDDPMAERCTTAAFVVAADRA